MTKEEYRRLIKIKRNTLNNDIHMSLCTSIYSILYNTEEYKNSNIIFSYISYQNEIDTRKFIKRILAEDKILFVPRVEGRVMNFYRISNTNSLVKNRFGILEPDKSYIKPYEKGDYIDKKYSKLMLFPGLVYDYNGNRIGYGAGYYDKYLNKYKEEEFIKIALAYDFQVFDKITSDKYDVKVDIIVTPSRLIRC